MITMNDVLQIFLMLVLLVNICYLIDEIANMPYRLGRQVIFSTAKYFFLWVFKRKQDHSLLVPIQWLIKNYIYFCYWLMGYGQFFILIGLEMEFRLHQVDSKPWYWFAGFIPISVGIFGVIQFLRTKQGASIFHMFHKNSSAHKTA
jgi:hypothetical protein